MAESQNQVNNILSNFLEKDVYVVVTQPVRSPDTLRHMEEHLASQVRLEKEGIMLAAGPMYEEGDDVPVAGMFVIRANSFEEARAIADEDPLHKRGFRTYTIRRWRINEGGLTVKVYFSDQSAEII